MIVSIGLLLGRISGFLREITIANTFGATRDSDFIVLLLTTPDFFVSLLMGGALSMALIPEFKKLSQEKGIVLYKQVTTVTGALGVILVFLMFFLKEDILLALAIGMDDEFIRTNEIYFFYSFLALPFSFATGASVAFLNAQERFTITSLGTVIVNVTLIVFILIAARYGNSFLLISVGLLSAAVLRWLSQVSVLSIIPFTLWKTDDSLITKNLVQRYVYALLSGIIIFSLPVVVRTIASVEGPGMLSLVNYSIKLVELPLVVLSSVFSLVVLPVLSEAFAGGNKRVFSDTASAVCYIVVSASLLVLIPLNIHSDLVATMIYGWGSLEPSQVETIGRFLSIYAIALPFQSLNGILLAIFSSRKDTKTPFCITLLLGFTLFGFLFIVKPAIPLVLVSVIIFYATMTFFYVFMLRFTHGVRLFNRSYNVLWKMIAILIVTFFVVFSTKGVVEEMPPFVGGGFLGFLIASVLASLFLIYKKHLKIGYE